MKQRSYRFSFTFNVERDVIIKADSLTDAMEMVSDVSPEMLLMEIDGTDFVFPSGMNQQTQVYPEHDFRYRCDEDGEEIDYDLLDDKDEV